MPGVCYSALRRLPRRDLHPLEKNDGMRTLARLHRHDAPCWESSAAARDADLERWPEDGRRYELYDGEVRVVPSLLPVHQVVVMNLVDVFRAYGREHGGLALQSPIDIIFSDYDVIQPDLVFFEASRRHLVRLDAPIRHHPDIAVEVLSPSTRAIDRGRKMQMFARYGMPESWIVGPDAKTIDVHVLRGDG